MKHLMSHLMSHLKLKLLELKASSGICRRLLAFSTHILSSRQDPNSPTIASVVIPVEEVM